MNLENVTVEMRPRSEWEAVDFGVHMVRRDAAAVYRVWFAVTLPILALALLAIVYSPYPTLAVLLYWWLEPVADGPILRIISRRLFGETADVGAALRATGKLAWRNKIFLLTPYRLHFARSIAMPLTQLERLTGATRRARAKVFVRIRNHGTGVTVAYQHLVLALYFGVILAGYALIPATYQDTLGTDWVNFFNDDGSQAASIISLLVIYAAQSAMQPWFVGAGFGLYINCRTQLEAWDVEVAFRRMLQRRTKTLATVSALAILFVSASLLPNAATAQEPTDSDWNEASTVDPGFSGFWDDEDVQPALYEVMATDALSDTREVDAWRAIDRDKPEQESRSETAGWWFEQMKNFGRLISLVVEFGLWILVAILLWLIFAARKHWLPYLAYRPKTKSGVRRIVLSGGELSSEDLPDDIPAEVIRRWQNSQKRSALSLLYRGSVFAAVTLHDVKLPRSATEGVCLTAIDQQTDNTHSDYFRRVVSVWIHYAYGFRDPGDDVVLPLCREWSQHYGADA